MSDKTVSERPSLDLELRTRLLDRTRLTAIAVDYAHYVLETLGVDPKPYLERALERVRTTLLSSRDALEIEVDRAKRGLPPSKD